MMSRHSKPLIALALAICAVGLGSTLAIAALSSPSSPSSPASSKAAAASAGGLSAVVTNPEAGLSDSQRIALEQQQRDAGAQRYAAWLNGLQLGNLDLHSLPRTPLNATWVDGQPNLQAAVAKADLVVVGTVSTVTPKLNNGIDTVIAVDQTLKGQAGSSVVIKQEGGLFPTSDWAGVVIGEGENGALLLPGDRAVLLLQKSSTGGYLIQSYTGWYQIVGGAVESNALNSWGSSINGTTENAFIQMVRAAE